MSDLPPVEIEERIAKLQERLSSAEIDLAIVLQSADLYYLSGTIQVAHLLVPREGAARLLVRKVLDRALEDSPIADIRSLTSLRLLREEIVDLCGPAPWRVGMELDSVPVASFGRYRTLFGEKAEIVDVSADLLALRAVKSPWEVDQIRAAAEINDRVYRDISDLLSEGLSTIELQAILDCRARTAGHLGAVRLRGLDVDGMIGVVVSGPTGATPGHGEFPIGGEGPHAWLPHGGDWNPIERNTPVIFDYLANRYGYHHDQTRMAVLGAFPAEAAQIYEGMREVLRTTERALAVGAIPSDVYELALDTAVSLGLGDGFMGLPGHAVRFVGHGIGLEVNEWPVLAKKFDDPLVVGNVLAVEPKFTHPEFGVIGIENTYALTEGGVERIGATPEDIVVVS